MSDSKSAPLIPDLDVPEVPAVAAEVKPLEIVFIDKEAKELESQVVKSLAPSKEAILKKRRTALHEIAFHMGVTIVQTITAAIVLTLAGFIDSPNHPGVNEWMVSENARTLGVWTIVRVLQGHFNWGLLLNDFIQKRGKYALASTDGTATTPAKKVKESCARRLFWWVQMTIACGGGWILGRSFFIERISAPLIWWLVCSFIIPLYPLFLSLAVVASVLSKNVIWACNMDKFVAIDSE
ncbi:hypothetical protein M422DRAFT_247803 [Sphaerobolus stellatus SS14]|nr:hypothetical protein M422DRAFT_247803 [Sphaerobolus stellatus SS14]